MKRENIPAMLEDSGDRCVLHHRNRVRRIPDSLLVKAVGSFGRRINSEDLSILRDGPCAEQIVGFGLPCAKSVARVMDYFRVRAS